MGPRYPDRMDDPRLASQAWFWTEEWQAGEREVDEQVARGEVRDFASSEEFLAYLRTITSEPEDR